MRKTIISLIIILAGFFIAGCVYDHVFYCPYCSYGSVSDKGDGTYTCTNSNCGKTFGAKEIKRLNNPVYGFSGYYAADVEHESNL